MEETLIHLDNLLDSLLDSINHRCIWIAGGGYFSSTSVYLNLADTGKSRTLRSKSRIVEYKGCLDPNAIPIIECKRMVNRMFQELTLPWSVRIKQRAPVGITHRLALVSHHEETDNRLRWWTYQEVVQS